MAQISVPENCVLVHPGGKNFGSCHLVAHQKEGRKTCLRHLIVREGQAAILDWLASLEGEFRSSILVEKVRLVASVDGGSDG